MSNNRYGGGSFKNGHNQGYNQNGNAQPQYNQAAYVGGDVQKARNKHSGCTKGTGKNGVDYVRGWNYSKRRGMLTVFCCRYKSSSEHTSPKSGITYTNLMAKVFYKDSGVEKIYGALLSQKTHRITIPELGMVLNPAAPNGGYFGKFTKKK